MGQVFDFDMTETRAPREGISHRFSFDKELQCKDESATLSLLSSDEKFRTQYSLRLDRHMYVEWSSQMITVEKPTSTKSNSFELQIALPSESRTNHRPSKVTLNITNYRWTPNETPSSSNEWKIPFVFKNNKASEKLPDNEKNHSEKYDRISGIYEGGFKLWDCSLDLASFLLYQCAKRETDEIHEIFSSYFLESTVRVLDIGCGQGLCTLAMAYGLHIFRESIGCSCDVHYVLQDYDHEVLIESTIPNIQLNMKLTKTERSFSMRNFCFAATSWRLFTELLTRRLLDQIGDQLHEHFDPFHILMGSDVLFSPESCVDVASLIVTNAISFFNIQMSRGLSMGSNFLSPIAFIGTKKHYFGTNGSVPFFLNQIREFSKQALANNAPVSLNLFSGLTPNIKTHWTSAEKDRVIISITFLLSKG